MNYLCRLYICTIRVVYGKIHRKLHLQYVHEKSYVVYHHLMH